MSVCVCVGGICGYLIDCFSSIAPADQQAPPSPLGIHSLFVALIRTVLYDRGAKQFNHIHSSDGLPLGML